MRFIRRASMWIESSKEDTMGQDSNGPLTEQEMCRRVAREVEDGYCINLGAGMPFPVADYISRDIWAMVHIEHGVLGVGTVAPDDRKDRVLMGLGRRPLTLVPGAACFSSVEAFTMLRG